MRRIHILTTPLAFVALACQGTTLPEIGDRTRSTATLHYFDSCDDLHATLRAHLKEEMRVQLLSNQGYYGMRGGVLEDAPTADAAGGEANGAPRQEGVDFSGTNNQEAGVDEADFVKMASDGLHMYLLNGNRLEILGVPTIGALTHEGTFTVEGWPNAMLRGNGRIVVFSDINTYTLPDDHPLKTLVGSRGSAYEWWFRSATLTKLTVIDVSNPSSPSALRELYIEGYYQTAREVADTVRMVSFAYMDIPDLVSWPELPDRYYQENLSEGERKSLWDAAALQAIQHNDTVIDGTPLASFLPQIYERLSGTTFIEHTFTESDCASFATADDGVSRGLTSMLTLDLVSPTFAFEHDHVVSNWSTVYASTDTLLVAEPAQDWWWYWNNDSFDEATNIHRFDISVAGRTTYTGSGRVLGTVGDQFSLSEHEDVVRVAATTGQWGRWWQQSQPPPNNHVYCLAGVNGLGGELHVVGQIGDIAVGERIWSSRFVGDEAYLVTFQNVDPLWTIDLSDPTSPVIKGELEVPGVSTYIHPLDGHLLTIGYSGDETGLDWSTQVSLFDVTDFENPLIDDTLSLAPPSSADGWSYAWSEATWEHKAFTYWPALEMLAIPLSTYRSYEDSTAEYGYAYEYYSRLQLIHVDSDNGTLTPFGEVDHSGFFNSDPDAWWESRDVRRSVFMKDSAAGTDWVYAISDRGVTSHRIDGASLISSATVELPGAGDQPYWWW